MDISTYLDQERGRAAELARHLKVKPVNVSRWQKKQKLVPARYCLRIEAWSAGAVTRQELRADDWRDYWGDLGTTSVPQAGRPPVQEVSDAA